MKEDGLDWFAYDAMRKAAGSEKTQEIVRFVQDYAHNMSRAADQIVSEAPHLLSSVPDSSAVVLIALFGVGIYNYARFGGKVGDNLATKLLDEELLKEQKQRSKLFPYVMREAEMREYNFVTDNNIVFKDTIDSEPLQNYTMILGASPRKKPSSILQRLHSRFESHRKIPQNF